MSKARKQRKLEKHKGKTEAQIAWERRDAWKKKAEDQERIINYLQTQLFLTHKMYNPSINLKRPPTLVERNNGQIVGVHCG